MRGDAPDVSNFEGGGAEDNVAGLYGADITLEGPMDKGNMPFTIGSTYAIVLTQDDAGPTTIAVTGRLTELSPTADVKDAQRVSLTFKSKSTFTAAIA